MFSSAKGIKDKLDSERNVARVVANEIILAERGLKRETHHNGAGLAPILKPVMAVVADNSSCRDTGELFGAGKDAVNDYQHGESLGDKKENASKNKKNHEDIYAPARELAVGVVSSALKLITEEKLIDLSAKSLSEITRNLSSVVRNLAGPKDESETSKFALNLFVPDWQRTLKSRGHIEGELAQEISTT